MKMKWQQALVLLPFLFTLVLPSLAFAENQAKIVVPTYELGIFPYLPPRELEKVFVPIVLDLSDALEKEILFKTTTTYEQFVGRLNNAAYDIALVQPFDYVKTGRDAGYVPIATRDEPLIAVIATIGESPVQELTDLRGKTLALPPASAAVSYLTKSYLIEHGLKPQADVRLKYTRSHTSCMHQVLVGEADACGTAPQPLTFFSKKMKVKTRIIAKTPGIPHTLFVVHSRVPQKDKDATLTRILSWSKTIMGQGLLRKGKFKPFVPIEDKDYDIVREHLKMLD